MKKLIPLLMLIAGCSSIPQREAIKISREPYLRGFYDCSNKATKLANILSSKGYDVRVIGLGKSLQNHARVELRVYLDATNGEVYKDNSGWEFRGYFDEFEPDRETVERTSTEIEEAKLKRWEAFNDNISK